MLYQVRLSANATRDLEEICVYIHRHGSPKQADYVMDQIEKAFHSLSEHPHRGNRPRDLLDVEDRECREVFFKPYRILYEVATNHVDVLAIIDGRRDVQSLLRQRLLQAMTS